MIKDLNAELPRQGKTYVSPDEQALNYSVMFDSQGGTSVSSISVNGGSAISRPTAPIRDGYVFAGWFSDAACTQAYDFSSPIYSNITLYAKWVVNNDSLVYRLTATHGVAEELYTYDKFIVEFRDVLVNPGDVLSFKYRSNIDFTYFSLRGDSKWFYERHPDYSYDYPNFFSSFEVMDDGWTYVSYEFPEEGAPTHQTITYGGEGTWFRIDFGSRTGEEGICIGDILEIKDLVLNGELLEITEDRVTRGVVPTLEIVNASDWKACTVTFDTLGGSTITPITVDFGRKIDMPVDPNKGGVLFTGWFEDAGYTIPFDSEMPITEDKVLYARWTSPRTVTFNSMGGSAVASVAVPTGWTVEKPVDPVKDSLKFVGWYTDSACTNAFDFGSSVTQNITLYAKWAEANRLTLNFNYDGAPQDEVLIVGRGAAIEEPKVPIRAGYYFEGWYEEAECFTAFDFTGGIYEERTIYAKWIEPDIYKYTATSSHERFAFRFKETTVEMLNNLNPGDVISFQVRFASTTTEPYQYRLRTRVNEKNICERTSFDAPGADGWYSITVTVPESIVNGQGLYLHLFGNGSWAIGDICEIRGLAYNGVEIPITTSTSSGLYPGIEATMEIVLSTGEHVVDGNHICTICGKFIPFTGPAGGYVFYDCDADNNSGNADGLISSECGWRYLEASPDELDFYWVEFGYYRNSDDGANLFVNGTETYDASNCTGTAIGTGQRNTQLLVAAMGDEAYAYESGSDKESNYAAKLCADLEYVHNGVVYDDWFLPSKDELNLMYTNLRVNDIGGFQEWEYWSSSEYSGNTRLGWEQWFPTGEQWLQVSRADFDRVRPIRAFL